MIIQNIIIQVSEKEHLSEERVLVRYKETEESLEVKSKIITKNSLSSTEKTKWTNFISLIDGKL
jgi:hypothetical protein